LGGIEDLGFKIEDCGPSSIPGDQQFNLQSEIINLQYPHMTPLVFVLLAFLVSVVAGTLGALLGLGGGLLLIPALTLWFHVDIRYAIGASIVSVIATSSGAAVTYVRDRLTNLRVAMVLELATTTGAMTGAYLAGRVGSKTLYIIFGVVMAYSAIMMFRKLGHEEDRPARRAPWGRLAPSSQQLLR
jgi:uncharacterized membrane protein YfcA